MHCQDVLVSWLCLSWMVARCSLNGAGHVRQASHACLVALSFVMGVTTQIIDFTKLSPRQQCLFHEARNQYTVVNRLSSFPELKDTRENISPLLIVFFPLSLQVMIIPLLSLHKTNVQCNALWIVSAEYAVFMWILMDTNSCIPTR